jgi:hypothetical protein
VNAPSHTLDVRFDAKAWSPMPAWSCPGPPPEPAGPAQAARPAGPGGGGGEPRGGILSTEHDESEYVVTGQLGGAHDVGTGERARVEGDRL